MSLPQVLFPAPTPQGLDEWAFHHLQHHRSIINATLIKKGVHLTLYDIYPINRDDLQGWLLQHQRMHTEADSLYGVQGADLTDVDFNNKKQLEGFFFLNFTEHRSLAQNCGLPI